MTLAWFSGSVPVCRCRGMTKNMSSNLTNYYYYFFFKFCCFLYLRNNYSLIIYNSVIQLSKVKKSKQDTTPATLCHSEDVYIHACMIVEVKNIVSTEKYSEHK